MSGRRLTSVVSISVALLMLALPAASFAAVPETVQEQVAWLADVYAAGLAYYWGQTGLSEERIHSHRLALAEGLKELLDEPLDAEQVCELTARVFSSTENIYINFTGNLITPHDLTIRDSRGSLLHCISLYLSRPRLKDPERSIMLRDVLSQCGLVLDALRRALISEFSDVPGAESLAAQAVFYQGAVMAQPVLMPVSPLLKDTLTEEEMAAMQARAGELAAAARRRWEEDKEELRQGGALQPVMDPATGAYYEMCVAAGSLMNELRTLHYAYRSRLTPEEVEVLMEYYSAAHDAAGEPDVEEASQ